MLINAIQCTELCRAPKERSSVHRRNPLAKSLHLRCLRKARGNKKDGRERVTPFVFLALKMPLHLGCLRRKHKVPAKMLLQIPCACGADLLHLQWLRGCLKASSFSSLSHQRSASHSWLRRFAMASLHLRCLRKMQCRFARVHFRRHRRCMPL